MVSERQLSEQISPIKQDHYFLKFVNGTRQFFFPSKQRFDCPFSEAKSIIFKRGYNLLLKAIETMLFSSFLFEHTIGAPLPHCDH